MSNEQVRDLLQRHAYFDGMGEATISRLAGHGRTVEIEAGTHVLREGQPADHLWAVVSGHVALDLASPGSNPLIIDTLGPDEILGVSWLVPPHKWAFDARAVEATRAVRLDAHGIRRICAEDPAFGYDMTLRMATVMQRRLRSARVRLLDIYGRRSA